MTVNIATTTSEEPWAFSEQLNNQGNLAQRSDVQGYRTNIPAELVAVGVPLPESSSTQSYPPNGTDTLTIGDPRKWIEIRAIQVLAESSRDEFSSLMIEYQAVRDAFIDQVEQPSVVEQRAANQAALELLDAWMAEPDDLGDAWWAEFEEELMQNRFSIERD